MYNPRALAETLATIANREALRGLRTQVLNPIVRRGIQGTFNRRKQYTLRGGYPKSTMRGRRTYLRRRRKKRARGASKRRNFRRRNVGRVGFNIGTAITRICKVDERTFKNINARQLYVYNISDIPIDTNTKINTRDRGMVNMRGWNVRFVIEMLSDTTRAQIFNWAIVVPKAAVAPVNGNFFRQFGDPTGTTRSQDLEVARSGLEMYYEKINSDLYYIVKHKHFMLNAYLATFQQENYGANHKRVNVYIPFSRQLHFDEGELTVKYTTPVYLVFWMDSPTESVSTPAYPAANYAHMVTAYFKNSIE